MNFNDDRLMTAPIPTKQLLRQRKSIPFQFLRFIALNFKILSMVHKAHEA
jgi:hypothetical protein